MSSLYPLAPPVEIPAIANGRPLSFRALSWTVGSVVIHPQRGAIPETVPCLRVWIARLGRASAVKYYDLLPSQLRLTILPLLEAHPAGSVVVTIEAHGYNARRQYSVSVALAEGGSVA